MEVDYTIGDRVVCVDATRNHANSAFDFQQWPVKDKEYTVRGFNDNDGIVLGVLLEELHNEPIYIDLIKNVQEPAFATWRFKKTQSMTSSHENKKSKTKIRELETIAPRGV